MNLHSFSPKPPNRSKAVALLLIGFMAGGFINYYFYDAPRADFHQALHSA